MTAVYVCLLLTLAIIASQMWNIWLLHKRIARIEARPEFPKELAVSVITADLVNRLIDDLEDDEEDEPTERSVN